MNDKMEIDFSLKDCPSPNSVSDKWPQDGVCSVNDKSDQ